MAITRAKTNREGLKVDSAKAGSIRPIQFNWRRLWSKNVAPYLHERLVQLSLDLGMRMLDTNWQTGDAPCDLGAIGFKRIVKGKLSWYQPLNRCHHIAFFSMAIGVLNYPELDWRFISGDRHTVAVGYDSEGKPRVVMDILLFDLHTAEDSIALAQEEFERLKPNPQAKEQWDTLMRVYVDQIVPDLRVVGQDCVDAVSNSSNVQG